MARTRQTKEVVIDTPQSIIDSALAVMAEEGIANLTTKLVSQRADVSTGAIHYFFDTKENLIYSAFLYMVKALSEETIAMRKREHEPLARIARSIEVHFSPFHFEAETSNIWPQFWAYAGMEPAVARLFNLFSARMISNHAADLRQAGLSRAEARLTAIELSALMRGLWLEKRLARSISGQECWVLLQRVLDDVASRTGAQSARFSALKPISARTGIERSEKWP